jgi:hypothetical protein
MGYTTITELPDSLRDPMRAEVNTGLMVAFINADLLNRCNLDVRTSIVLYRASGLFEAAAHDMADDDVLQHLHDTTTVRYSSRSIV